MGKAVVLLVEEEEAMRQVLTRFLTNKGLRVLVADDSEVGANMWFTNYFIDSELHAPIKLIIADQTAPLPDRLISDSLTMVRVAKELCRFNNRAMPPVIFTYSSLPSAEMEEKLKAEGQLVLSKPFSLDELWAAIEKLLLPTLKLNSPQPA